MLTTLAMTANERPSANPTSNFPQMFHLFGVRTERDGCSPFFGKIDGDGQTNMTFPDPRYRPHKFNGVP